MAYAPGTINEDGTPVLIETVVYRYGVPDIDEHDTIDEAQAFIDSGEDYGSFSSIGVYVDGEPHSAGPWDWHTPLAGERGRTIDGMRKEYARAKAVERVAAERPGQAFLVRDVLPPELR